MALFRIALYQNESHIRNPTKQLAQIEDAVKKATKHNVNLTTTPKRGGIKGDPKRVRFSEIV